MQETWKDIIEFENLYQISNYGRVKNKRTNKILKNILNSHGYYVINLYDINRKLYTRKIHRLVASHFIPNTNNYLEINHKDGNKQNNYVENLEWCNHSMNMQHAVKNGLRLLGEKHHQAKLTQNDVDYIRNHYIPYHKEFGGHALGRKFGVVSSQISNIINLKTYKN